MKALSGVKVIDLSRILSGPYCTMVLADLGAEVIKVESPGGDDTRKWGPPFVEEESAYFLSINRNKKSVDINLKTDQGKEILLDLVKEADIVVENFKPGTLKRLGIGYETLKETNPSIILASISGYGQTGPYSSKPGYDVIAQGMGGITSVTGEPGQPPVKVGFSIADIGTGMWAGVGILSALYKREKTGEGEWIDVSLLDTIISWHTYFAGNYFASGKNPQPQGGAHPNIVPYQLFESSDGYFNVAVGNEKLWAKFCDVIGEPQLADDPDYALNENRVENREALISILQSKFIENTSDHWIDLFESVDIPSGPVLTFDEIYKNEHVLSRNMLIEAEHPTAGNIKMTGNPVKFSEAKEEEVTAPPLHGQHTKEILSSILGKTDADLDELVKNNVIKKQEGNPEK